MYNLVVIPGSPALAEPLASHDAASRGLLRAATELISEICSGSSLENGSENSSGAERMPVDIVCSWDKRWYTSCEGSLRAWGAPSVEVGQGHHLPEIMARYVLAESAVGAQVEQVRDTLAPLRDGVLTVVVVDGSAGLTQRAPLAMIDSAQEAHLWCEALLSGTAQGCDEEKLRAAGVLETSLWAQLAALNPVACELRAADSTLGVGRYVAGWQC
ncbi:hypothetical protein [Corynebacterium sp.]|uniref:hypothetical protein n=1 Tax=Corynebacterium sp. TaxID=1720 RepID=UPI0026DABC49|nr:hypothetical protein [Corynebacterium sp.]MDO5031681.1 hypothetical protein [Corynebacterium sp.]